MAVSVCILAVRMIRIRAQYELRDSRSPYTRTRTHTHALAARHINYKSFVAKVSIYSHLSCSRRNHFAFSPSAATLSNHQQRTHTHTHIQRPCKHI